MKLRNKNIFVVLFVTCVVVLFIEIKLNTLYSKRYETQLIVLRNQSQIHSIGVRHASQPNQVQACNYFESAHNTCNMTVVCEQIQRVMDQNGCIRWNVPPEAKILFHMFLTNIYIEDEGYYLSMKAYLITQDLRKTQLFIWTDDKNMTWLMNSKFIRKHFPYIQIHFFNYTLEIQNTPLEKNNFFRSVEQVRSAMSPSTYSDIVRNIILHNYGHIWIDNDAVLLRDLLPITVGIGYQFITRIGRHTNGHVMFHYPRSKLAKRILSNLIHFPMKFDNDKKQYVPDNWPLQPKTKLISWVYNDALPSIIKEQANLTDYEDRQFWYDIAWFDPLWRSCFSSDKIYKNTKIILYDSHLGKKLFEQLSCNLFFILHTRYPKLSPTTFNNSLLYFLIERIDEFFSDSDISMSYNLESMNLLFCRSNLCNL